MRTTDAGRAFIERHEGCRLRAYRDGAGIWTIGYGHTNGVYNGLSCTQDQADAWLTGDLDTVEQCISKGVPVPLNPAQFDALASFTFNLGCQAFMGSTLRRLLNELDYAGAADQFGRWVHDANGDVEPGLVTRRADERTLFTGGGYG